MTMNTESKAKALLIELAEGAAMLCVTRPNFTQKPGAVIERLPPEKREILKELTSDDATGMRVAHLIP